MLHLVREYLTHWTVAGVIIAATGAAPEHWFAEGLHGIHLPNGILPPWLAGVDYRLLAVISGVGLIVADTVWRNHARMRAVPLPPADSPAAHATPPHGTSIAVLPFENLSGDPEQDYFASGMVSDITNSLSRTRWLSVIARNGALTLQNRRLEAREAGRELNVRYVLEGAVRKAGDTVRITGRLIEAETGHQLWGDHFDGELADVLALQDRVADAVAKAIAPSVRNAEIDRIRRKPLGSVDAYDLYLRALFTHHEMTREAVDEALALLRKSLAADPHFAPAAALSASLLCYRVSQGWAAIDAEMNEAERLAHRAIEESADDAEVLATAATAIAYVGRALEEATEIANRALSLNPHSADVLRCCGVVAYHAGRFRPAIEYLKSSSAIDPLSPTAYTTYTYLAVCHLSLDEFEPAVAAARRAIQQRRTFTSAWRALIAALALAGHSTEAEAATHELLTLEPNFSMASLTRRWHQPWRERYFEGLRRAGLPD